MRKSPVVLGELTEQVTLGRKTLTGDGAGGATSADDVYAPDVWAHVRPLSGDESQSGAERTEAMALYLVVVRNRDDVKPGDFVRWAGKDLNVRFTRNRGPREHFLEIEAEAGAGV